MGLGCLRVSSVFLSFFLGERHSCFSTFNKVTVASISVKFEAKLHDVRRDLLVHVM
jgi:hypothetical protein